VVCPRDNKTETLEEMDGCGLIVDEERQSFQNKIT